MTLDDALAIVIARTKHERYRWLCSDANPDPAVRDGCRSLVFRLAGEPEPPPLPSPLVPLSASIRAVKLGLRNCFYSTREGCGCSGATCHHLGRVVTLTDCLKCLPEEHR